MEFDAKSLEDKLNCYFRGEVSKGDLGEWANKAYYDILRGGYIETEKNSDISILKNNIDISR